MQETRSTIYSAIDAAGIGSTASCLGNRGHRGEPGTLWLDEPIDLREQFVAGVDEDGPGAHDSVTVSSVPQMDEELALAAVLYAETAEALEDGGLDGLEGEGDMERLGQLLSGFG